MCVPKPSVLKIGVVVPYVPKLDVMKHLMTLVALFGSFALMAQLPYNPDANGDGLIGVADLQGLLATYGSEFENVIVAEDGESALLQVGMMNYFECENACDILPGFWEIPKASDLVPIMPVTSPWAWTQTPDNLQITEQYMVSYFRDPPELVFSIFPGTNRRCYCAAKQLPRMEYSYCEGGNIEECTSTKVQEGWYPLGGISTHENLGTPRVDTK